MVGWSIKRGLELIPKSCKRFPEETAHYLLVGQVSWANDLPFKR